MVEGCILVAQVAVVRFGRFRNIDVVVLVVVVIVAGVAVGALVVSGLVPEAAEFAVGFVD
jgi:hypothetical protein